MYVLLQFKNRKFALTSGTQDVPCFFANLHRLGLWPHKAGVGM